MKRSTIIILATIIGVSVICLLGLQVWHIVEVHSMRKQMFDETVTRCLLSTAHQMEIDEANRFLQRGTLNENTIRLKNDSIPTTIDTSSVLDAHDSRFFTRKSNRSLTPDLQEILRQRKIKANELVDEVVYSLLYSTSDMLLEDRIDFSRLDQTLKSEFSAAGINDEYHYQVLDGNGKIIYQCRDYTPEGREWLYTTDLFPNSPVSQMGKLAVNFPNMSIARQRALMFFLPTILFSAILVFTFVLTLVIAFRQKKVREMKSDFINNMTHEFKTPISSISLAAQMLNDPSVRKTPQLTERLSSTIMDETKRLRFQVDKVLQLSLYENQKIKYNIKEIDASESIAGIVHTFALKVERGGGKIITDLRAENPFILVDEMHFTNVIFNLMDNAVKYCRTDAPLELKISIWNEQKNLVIAIKDNGIGMRKEDLKKIFEKFYRVHTGNLHDVKGFGLGLAYVKKIVTAFSGTIYAESEPDLGTTFFIKLPVVE